MKKLLIAIALITLTASASFGQKKTNGDDQTLMKMEQEMSDAVTKGDTAVLDKYIAENASLTDPGGMMSNKAQFIAMLKSGDLKIQSTKIEDMKVQMFDNTAVVTYRTADKGTFKGTDITGNYRWTDVFVKSNGKWRLVAGHGTPIMQQ
jgi:hypothetical protein